MRVKPTVAVAVLAVGVAGCGDERADRDRRPRSRCQRRARRRTAAEAAPPGRANAGRRAARDRPRRRPRSARRTRPSARRRRPFAAYIDALDARDGEARLRAARARRAGRDSSCPARARLRRLDRGLAGLPRSARAAGLGAQPPARVRVAELGGDGARRRWWRRSRPASPTAPRSRSRTTSSTWSAPAAAGSWPSRARPSTVQSESPTSPRRCSHPPDPADSGDPRLNQPPRRIPPSETERNRCEPAPSRDRRSSAPPTCAACSARARLR